MPCIPSHYAVCSALRWVASMDRGERTLRAEELAGDVQGLASHDDDLLAVEQLLGDRGGQATEKVALAVDDLAKVLAGVVSPVRRHRWRFVWFFGVRATRDSYDNRLECRHGDDLSGPAG
jgi:hypothetical protein